MWLMLRLDEIAANITDQIETAVSGIHVGVQADRQWLRAAGRALKEAKLRRTAAQERRGQLNRAQRANGVALTEKLFVDAAKELLPVELWEKVWVRVAELRGEE
jgi:hypothetical protein